MIAQLIPALQTLAFIQTNLTTQLALVVKGPIADANPVVARVCLVVLARFVVMMDAEAHAEVALLIFQGTYAMIRQLALLESAYSHQTLFHHQMIAVTMGL
jgi:hypothetical protein